MLINYTAYANTGKESLKNLHLHGHELIRAIEADLTIDPLTRALKLRNTNTYAQVFTPEITPAIEIRIKYEIIGEKILIKLFEAILIK